MPISVLDEIKQFSQRAKWSDDELLSHIEHYIDNEAKGLSPLPGVSREMHVNKTPLPTRLNAYLDYFSQEEDATPLLVHLAGELPEPDITSFTKNDSVYWIDPDDAVSSGWYTITDILVDDDDLIS